MSDDPSYILDISSLQEASGEAEPTPSAGPETTRSWIGMQFECCGTYTRIYRNSEGTAYVGHCPRCHRRVQVGIGPGGTDARMFRAV